MPTLADLPIKLVEDIYDEVYRTHPKQYLGSVSSHLLPVARRVTFASVKVGSYARLKLLCEVVEASDEVAERVRDLEIDIHRADEDVESPASSEVVALFSRLSNVESLAITGSERIAMVALEPANEDVMPSLYRLEIRDPLYGWIFPFCPSHYASLRHYSSLTHLSLDLDNLEALPVAVAATYVPVGPLPPIVLYDLVLIGRVGEFCGVADLIAPFTDLERLCINEFHHFDVGGTLTSLLEAVQTPESLLVLTLSRNSSSDFAFENEDLSVPLSRFNNLEALWYGVTLTATLVTPTLCRLPHLSRLSFGMSSGLCRGDLLSLVGKMRPPALREIRLHDLVDDGFERRTLGLDIDTVETAYKMGKAVGVVVGGSSLDGLIAAGKLSV
jgi:hypothetical protein